MRSGLFFTLSIATLFTASLAFAVASSASEGDTRSALRRSAGNLEARAADTRAFVGAEVNARGAELESARAALLDERIPALQRDLDALRAAVVALEDAPLRAGAGGIEVAVDSCWPKWKRFLAADKYLFRAAVRVDEGAVVRGMSIREPANGDVDLVRVPAPKARDDGKPGQLFEIYDSFKIWGSEAELVVEDANGVEHVTAFECD